MGWYRARVRRCVGWLDASLPREFGHAQDAQQDRQHDPADENRQAEDQRRLENRQEPLDGHLHLAVVDIRDPCQHFLEAAG